jgi:hypothetical protein
MPTDGCVKCWAPTVGNLLYVIGCFPLWIIDAVKKGFSPSYIYDRLKPRCSSNGKNQGTYWYIPYFFETMAAIPCFILVVQFMAGYHASVSFWIHTKPLIDAGYGFNYSAGTDHFDLVWREPYAGRLFEPEKYDLTWNRRFGPNIWSPFYNPVETGYTTLLDKELLAGQVVADKTTGTPFKYDPEGNGLDPANTKALIDDMIDNHYNHTAQNMHYTLENRGGQIEPEHFITVSHRCMCIGVMPCNSYFGFGCAAGSSQKWHRQCKAPSCIKRPERMHYFEINRSEIDVGSYRMTRCRRYAMCIGGLVLGRFFAMLFCRTQLRRPGSGAYNGWVIAGMCWVLGNYIRWKIIPTLVHGRPGWHKFWRKGGKGSNNIIYAFSYGAYGYLGGFDRALSYSESSPEEETEGRAKGKWENNVSAMAQYRNTGAIAQLWIIAVSSILANFFGGEAYCTDLSNYAYTSKNLNRYRERVRLANL